MIPVFWKQLIFKSFRNSFMKGRNCLHLKASAHKTTAPLAKINLSIMVPDDGQCRANALYWLCYNVKMFCRVQWEGHFGSAFLSAMKQRRYFQHFDSLGLVPRRSRLGQSWTLPWAVTSPRDARSLARSFPDFTRTTGQERTPRD